MAARDANEVGSPGAPAAGGGHQTAEQAEAIARNDSAGRSDADRKADWAGKGGAGKDPVPPGGSSQGQSDRKPAT